MVFSGLPFLILFLPLFLLLYFAIVRLLSGKGAPSVSRAANVILLIFSLFFYAWGEARCLPLMMFSAFVDYVDGLLLAHFEGRPHARRLCLTAALLINFLLLGIFKYADFVTGILNALPGVELPLPGIALPIGISFYTFQTTSYSIDVYRGKVRPERNYFRYLTYVSMFPQLIAGPIVRYETVAEKLKERTVDGSAFSAGFFRFLTGLFRKVLIANELGAVWASLNTRTDLSVTAAWLGLVTFTLQLYFDFSAYSDMAIGLGRMLGFTFDENFNYPLAAVSLTDFWRRWHISLSGWFRDYVYIPLGGNRRGTPLQLRNLFIVWFLTGLWHGASWNFVLWGLYHGLFLVLEKFVWGRGLSKLPRLLQHLYAWVIIVVGFGLFYFEDLSAFGSIMTQAFGLTGNAFAAEDLFWTLTNNLPVLLAAVVLAFPVWPKILEVIRKRLMFVEDPAGARSAGMALMIRIAGCAAAAGAYLLCIANLVRDSYNPFLYFRF